MYVKNDVKVMCRFDFEELIMEGFWVEVCLVKLCSFLIGKFKKLLMFLNYVVKDFMFIFDSCFKCVMVINKEVIIIGDLNCDFC